MPTPAVVLRRRRKFRTLAALAAIAILAAVGLRIYVMHGFAPAGAEMAFLSETESEIFRLVNGERLRQGLKPLEVSARLAVVARGHSYDMAIRHYESHKSPEGSTPADRVRGVGIGYKSVGENVYADNGSLAELPERALKLWLKSPEDRAVLLSADFHEIGIGVVRSSDGRTYVTQDFIS